MSGSASLSLEKFFSSLMGRVGLVFLTTMVSAGAFGLLLGFDIGFHINLVSALLLTGLGLVSGFSSRLLLKRHTRALQLTTALVGAFVGLVVFGLMSRGDLGLELEAGDDAASLKTFLQVFWSGTTAWLSVRAWNRAQKKVSIPVKSRPKNSHPKKRQKETKPTGKVASRKPKKGRIGNPFHGLIQSLDLQRRLKGVGERLTTIVDWKTLKGPGIGRRVKLMDSKRSSPRIAQSNSFRRKLERIKLVGIEEHNCPYCLEPVTKADPRGLKICSICKTWHHADCWAEAGECQVPHQHDL